MTFYRPAGVSYRVNIGGSASQLRFDHERMNAAAGPIRWQTPGYNSTVNRYDITITGSVSDFTIDTQTPSRRSTT
jgi:hypothetical protein